MKTASVHIGMRPTVHISRWPTKLASLATLRHNTLPRLVSPDAKAANPDDNPTRIREPFNQRPLHADPRTEARALSFATLINHENDRADLCMPRCPTGILFFAGRYGWTFLRNRHALYASAHCGDHPAVCRYRHPLSAFQMVEMEVAMHYLCQLPEGTL